MYKAEKRERQIISVKDAIRLPNLILDIRDKTMVLVLFKTGIRRKELLELNVDNIDFEAQSIILTPTPKRTNRTVFFDQETKIQLKRWLRVRENWSLDGNTKALFISRRGLRLSGQYLQNRIYKYATHAGLHDPNSKKPENRFSPHCCRHWNNTHLLRAGMKCEYVKWLRGDVPRESIDIYYHIDPEEVKQSYLNHMPIFGIWIC